jgi:hypothetical protein
MQMHTQNTKLKNVRNRRHSETSASRQARHPQAAHAAARRTSAIGALWARDSGGTGTACRAVGAPRAEARGVARRAPNAVTARGARRARGCPRPSGADMAHRARARKHRGGPACAPQVIFWRYCPVAARSARTRAVGPRWTLDAVLASGQGAGRAVGPQGAIAIDLHQNINYQIKSNGTTTRCQTGVSLTEPRERGSRKFIYKY